jgi:hypothetical protein
MRSACGFGSSLSDWPGEARYLGPSGPTSGVEGQILIRPVRSVDRRDGTNEAPYQARVSVLDAKGNEIGVAESDVDGNFRLGLPPGSYVLHPQSSGRYPRAAEQKVVVRANKWTQVEIVYDSGKR